MTGYFWRGRRLLVGSEYMEYVTLPRPRKIEISNWQLSLLRVHLPIFCERWKLHVREWKVGSRHQLHEWSWSGDIFQKYISPFLTDPETMQAPLTKIDILSFAIQGQCYLSRYKGWIELFYIFALVLFKRCNNFNSNFIKCPQFVGLHCILTF